MIAAARVAAFKALMSLSSERGDLASIVAHARASLADERDRALATEIVYGVQRWQAALDAIIQAIAGRPTARLDREIVNVLRLSLYQLQHLTRVPKAAVVNDAVEMTRKAGKKSASGFVNAVLRKAGSEKALDFLPPRPVDDSNRELAIDYLSTTLSHPRWLATRWHDRLGLTTAETWMRFNNTPGSLTLRANRLRATPNEVRDRLRTTGTIVTPGRFAPDSLTVDSGHPTGHDFVIQDEASQLVTLLAGEHPGPQVLDTCASPGGKATALAAAMLTHQGRLLVACDVRERRIDLLRRTIETTGASEVRIVQADALDSLPFSRVFDCVIVDAPCSGLGTLRRDPDIKWKRTEADLPLLADRQLKMLVNAAAVVKPSGRLVYATCSSEPDENEFVVDRFLAASRFQPLDAAAAHPQLASTLVDSRGHFRTAPHLHQLECFFGAVLEAAR
jgi:16S rRNA (cytosine967-C5)-methyltransferase